MLIFPDFALKLVVLVIKNCWGSELISFNVWVRRCFPGESVLIVVDKPFQSAVRLCYIGLLSLWKLRDEIDEIFFL